MILLKVFRFFYTWEVCGGRVPLVELVAIVPIFVEDFGEGRPWCSLIDFVVEVAT